MIRVLTALTCLVATPALAELEVTFSEGAPKDRFTMINGSQCALRDVTVTIDLAGSAAGLVFDTTPAGAGVEVFQPFEIVAGGETLAAEPVVRDGDRALAIAFSNLPTGGTFAFTIDVDDTIQSRGITVSDAELAGATVRLGGASATFGQRPSLRVSTPECD